jgi:hypothetical protein
MSYFKYILIGILILSTACIVALYVMVGSALPAQVHPVAPPNPAPVNTPHTAPTATTTPKVVMPAEEWLEKTMSAWSDGVFSTRTWETRTASEIIKQLSLCRVSVIILPPTSTRGSVLVYLRDGTEVEYPNPGISVARKTNEVISASQCTPPILVHYMPWVDSSCIPSDMCI